MENEEKDRFRDLLKDYAAGKLPSEQKNSIENHLKNCESCKTEIIFVRDMYEVMQKIDENLAKLKASIEAPEDERVKKDSVYQKLEKIIYIDPNRGHSRYSPRWYVTLISQSLQEKMKKRQMTRKEYNLLNRNTAERISSGLWNRGIGFFEN